MLLSAYRLNYCLTAQSVKLKYIFKTKTDICVLKRRYLARMSEPPLKRKRTILDFFRKTDNTKKTGSKKIETKTMATADTGSFKKTRVSDTEKPGPSKSTRGATESDCTDEQDIEQVDSQELATSQTIPTKKPSQKKDGSDAWKGITLKMLDKLPDTTGELKNDEHHKVLFKLPFRYNGSSPPYPYHSYKDKWDASHVRMPCSPASEYPATNKNGAQMVRRRWEMIQEVLLGDIPGPYELEEKIISYNSRYFGKWNFEVLNTFFLEELDETEKRHFFNNTLKKIAHLALKLDHLVTTPIPLLKAGKSLSITLSQQQIACLLANAFFCTFPRRNAKSKTSEYSRYPNINFNTLYMGQPSKVKFEKLKCLLRYFTRVVEKMPCGTVTFTRQCVDRLPDWDNDDSHLRALHVSSEATIEDDGEGFLQVDFANSYLGGGVLGHGCVQEEIRFLICPEMLVTRLFTECLNPNECLIMKGCERFSDYDGYASKFEWKADYVDKTPRDSWGRIQCEVVAIDALVIHDHKAQFQQGKVKRELNKAYCGFLPLKTDKGKVPAVCTGNWGCGAFGGDKQLKALIQLMAAAKAGRDMCYFTFDDKKLRDELFEAHKYMTEKLLTIGDVMELIRQYNMNWFNLMTGDQPSLNIFDYIKKHSAPSVFGQSGSVGGQISGRKVSTSVSLSDSVINSSESVLDDEVSSRKSQPSTDSSDSASGNQVTGHKSQPSSNSSESASGDQTLSGASHTQHQVGHGGHSHETERNLSHTWHGSDAHRHDNRRNHSGGRYNKNKTNHGGAGSGQQGRGHHTSSGSFYNNYNDP